MPSAASENIWEAVFTDDTCEIDRRMKMTQKKKECREVITLVMRLAKNDFKTKYAGSYLGIFWAFVQPVVTVLVYWFVFSKLRSGMVREVPFILWLIAGLVPWFYFQDCMNTGCNALIEYSYLVKKVVFRIEVLPVVKIVSALFVHLFFIAVVLVLYTVMGHVPGITAIQIIYYTPCRSLSTNSICRQYSCLAMPVEKQFVVVVVFNHCVCRLQNFLCLHYLPFPGFVV